MTRLFPTYLRNSLANRFMEFVDKYKSISIKY